MWKNLQSVIVIFFLAGVCSVYANNVEGYIENNLLSTDAIASEELKDVSLSINAPVSDSNIDSNCDKKCNANLQCDGKGRFTREILDKYCNCITVFVASPQPTCPVGQTYNAATCGCIGTTPVVCTKTCDTRVHCDGKGGLTTQVLNTKDCSCETKSVAPPTCPTGKVYNPTTCGCVNAVTTPTTPTSNVSAGSSINCSGVKVTGDKGAITISGLTAPNQIVKVFDAKFQTVFNCSGNCKETEIVRNLVGDYSVHIDAYSSAWHFVCGVKENVRVDAGIVQPPVVQPPVVQPPVGNVCGAFSAKEVNGQIVISGPTGANYTYSIVLRDDKGQQICTEITIPVPGNTVVPTCLDGSPLKTPGTKCDDRDSKTHTDVIQADGCSCVGTPVVPVDPCAARGGDWDKDGICAIDDCDDRNQFIGAKQIPGTKCDDRDSKTHTDVIQADGCSCAGTPVVPVDPCASKGGDKDGDGICALDDCDDNNRRVGAKQRPGTKCDDGRPRTQNDVIQADGCSCRGVVLVDPCARRGGDKDGDGVCADEDCNDNNPNIGRNRACPAGSTRIDRCTCRPGGGGNGDGGNGNANGNGNGNANGNGNGNANGGGGANGGANGNANGNAGGGFDTKNTSATGRSATPSRGDEAHLFYPNPAKTTLFLDLNDYAGKKSTIHLMDAFGKVVQQLDFERLPQDPIKVNLMNSDNGLHFINVIIDNEKVVTEKVMINKF